jgi:hypothetical protein
MASPTCIPLAAKLAMLDFPNRVQICTPVDNFRNFLAYFAVFPIIIRLIHREQIGMAFGHLLFNAAMKN